jgi:4-oxalomesaconate hydratase
LDHINLRPRDVKANREFFQKLLGLRLTEQIVFDDGTEVGGWLAATFKSYDLAITLDRSGARGRLHHFTYFMDSREEVLKAADILVENGVPIETGPHKHSIGQTFFLYCYEPGGNRFEIGAGGYLIFDPDWQPIVWRAAGAIATVTQSGGTAKVIALSYGERGESGELWKEAGQTEEKVKAIRRTEGEEAATILGASFEGMDLGDYPLELDRAAMERLTAAIREFAPTVILTHAKEDPFNPDHGVAYAATEKARQLASGAGVASAFKTIRPPALLLFEPHQPELCGFYPNTFLDITPVFEKKRAAMEVMGAQGYLREYYSQRASQRANHARRICGDKEIKFAEAFQRITPTVLKGF